MFELYDESKKEELKKIYLERAQEKVRKLLEKEERLRIIEEEK